MLAGAALADQALKEHVQRYDLVYPMLYCYRHAVEIGLKWLIAQYGPPVDVKPLNLSETHNIWILWQACLRIDKKCGAGEEDESLKVVEKNRQAVSRLGQAWDDVSLCNHEKRRGS